MVGNGWQLQCSDGRRNNRVQLVDVSVSGVFSEIFSLTFQLRNARYLFN
jgi:hypothetical protein